jgi:hypothetical protein
MDLSKIKFQKRQIGKITNRVICLLELDIPEDTPIYINDHNIEIIQEKHPDDFMKYGNDIEEILNNPDLSPKN